MSSSTAPIYFQTMSPAPTSTSTPTPPAPQSSALPPHTSEASNTTTSNTLHDDSKKPVKPHRKPLLRLELRDLSSSGTRAFLRLVHASSALEDAVDSVLRHLYSGMRPHCIPPTRSVTLILRSMGGVAYTTGTDLDDDHKEIHFSTDYINSVPDTRQKEEIMGVIVHEMVHCWQHNALGTAPGGLIEGIADWVRLKAGLAPPHWRRRCDCDWDAGYERTGFFLEWLEKEHGEDIVRKINEGLRGCKYESDIFWKDCCGKRVKELWKEYECSFGDHDGDDKKKMAEPKKNVIDNTHSSSTDNGTDSGDISNSTTGNDGKSGERSGTQPNKVIPVRPRFT